MATPIAMPRQGNTVENCTIVEWHKTKGDTVAEGDVIFTYETDKATFEFESPVAGTLLDTFYGTDEDIPVLTNVAVVGSPGETYDEHKPSAAPTAEQPQPSPAPGPAQSSEPAQPHATQPSLPAQTVSTSGNGAISPRARTLAESKGIDPTTVTGTGPKGRIIERDIQAALQTAPMMTPTAVAKAQGRNLQIPASGTGIGGRIAAADLIATTAAPAVAAAVTGALQDSFTEVPFTKMRSIIADRMASSLQSTAQLTMNASADASGLLAYRKKVKALAEKLGLNNINITDMVAYALTRVLLRNPAVNALVNGSAVRQYDHVHLALAVDTPRGLMVPVVRFADSLSLNELAAALKLAAKQCADGSINPDTLTGGTLTLSNLGTFGIESFTPILNPPQVAILGLNTISPKPVLKDNGEWCMVPHIGLSMTIDHRALDGAPAARFLNELVSAIENFELMLSV